jgi:hypothetical protein
MGDSVRTRDLVEWCRVPAEELEQHPQRRVPLRIVRDGPEMGRLMARELVDLIDERNRAGQDTRVIVPCGPSSWYAPWTEDVNRRGVSLARLHVFHMDECLDWQGQPLPRSHSVQLPDLHGAALLRRDRRPPAGARVAAALAAARDDRERARRDRGGADRPRARRLGPGRPRRVQPGAPSPIRARQAWRSSSARRSGSRRTTSTRSSHSRSAPSARPTSWCRRCR